MLGKGASMRDGALARPAVRAASSTWTATSPACARHRHRPGRPLLEGEADFVKARFGRGGGRVTELTAKPMLKVFFPELAISRSRWAG
jgi:glucosyl-3-phosphoglycerate synthase